MTKRPNPSLPDQITSKKLAVAAQTGEPGTPKDKQEAYMKYLALEYGKEVISDTWLPTAATALLYGRDIILIEQTSESDTGFYLWAPKGDQVRMAAAYLGLMCTAANTKGPERNDDVESALFIQLIRLSSDAFDGEELENKITKKYLGLEWETLEEFQESVGKVVELKAKNLPRHENPIMFYFQAYN
jgi:hypothetical protein